MVIDEGDQAYLEEQSTYYEEDAELPPVYENQVIEEEAAANGIELSEIAYADPDQDPYYEDRQENYGEDYIDPYAEDSTAIGDYEEFGGEDDPLAVGEFESLGDPEDPTTFGDFEPLEGTDDPFAGEEFKGLDDDLAKALGESFEEADRIEAEADENTAGLRQQLSTTGERAKSFAQQAGAISSAAMMANFQQGMNSVASGIKEQRRQKAERKRIQREAEIQKQSQQAAQQRNLGTQGSNWRPARIPTQRRTSPSYGRPMNGPCRSRTCGCI